MARSETRVAVPSSAPSLAPSPSPDPATGLPALAPLPAVPSDAALVAALVAGEREALAALYDRYAPALLALAQRMLRSPTDAEDLLHDFFIEVWQNAHSYDGQRGSVHSWLVVRLRSRALDRLKSAAYRRAAQEQTSGVALDELMSPVDPTAAASSPGLARALSLLTPHEQVLLELAYFEGYTLAEVAGRLALPLGTVKSRLRRLLERLRRDLDRQQRRGPP